MPDALIARSNRPPDNHRRTGETDPLESRSVGRSLRNVTYVTPSAWGGGMTPSARAWAKAAVALALVSLVACTGSNGEPAPPRASKAIDRSTPPASTAPADPQAAVKAKVLTAYMAFWHA